jgi:glycosyltransferase involved in cell wall biosynthesis
MLPHMPGLDVNRRAFTGSDDSTFPSHGQDQGQNSLGMGLKIVYTAPNRAHHYGYARELYQAGILKAFVCGFPRYSSRSPIPEIGNTLKRVDQLQTIYLASQKLRLPRLISEELAYRSQMHIDNGSRQSLNGANLFLFYNGCGLDSARCIRRSGGIGIVEAVNTHVLVQEQLLAEEHKLLGLPWHPFHRQHVRRRVAEVEEAEYVLLPSTFVARSYRANGIPADRLLLIPFPPQKIAGAVEPSHKSDNDESVFRVLYVGTISVRKGLRYLIEAFRRLKHPKKELWIVGPVTNPSGLEDISVPEEAKFLGPLKGNDLQKAYMSATVFCLPSIEEGQALVLSEALSYGLPVIATENTGIEDLLDNGSGAMVVPIRDARAICDWLDQLAADKKLLNQMRAKAFEAKSRLENSWETKPTLANTLLRTFSSDRVKKPSEVV